MTAQSHDDMQSLINEIRKNTAELTAQRKVVEKLLTPGVDGLTDSQRLQLKQLAEIHNRLAECTLPVKDILIEIRDLKTRQKIQDRTPAPATPAVERKMSKCGSKNFQGCGAEIYWKDKKPYNPDDTPHRCGGIQK